MKKIASNIGLSLVVLLVAACSSTTMSGSWSDPAFTKQLQNIYIIGISNNETNRRIFEDSFGQKLAIRGIKAVSSYRDLPNGQEANREEIIKRMTQEGCDSVLLTRLVDTRKETVTSPGRVSGIYESPYYGSRYYGRRGGYYNSWGSYYGQRQEFVYQPPTSTEFLIVTIESVLYDLQTEEMIWSGQLETVVETNIEKMVQDFVEEVTKDLAQKGII